MSIKINCNGTDIEDCFKCERMYSSHSLHYCIIYRQKITNINCSVGGSRVFDEKGKRIDNN